jgi:hypothetical protein
VSFILHDLETPYRSQCDLFSCRLIFIERTDFKIYVSYEKFCFVNYGFQLTDSNVNEIFLLPLNVVPNFMKMRYVCEHGKMWGIS